MFDKLREKFSRKEKSEVSMDKTDDKEEVNFEKLDIPFDELPRKKRFIIPKTQQKVMFGLLASSAILIFVVLAFFLGFILIRGTIAGFTDWNFKLIFQTYNSAKERYGFISAIIGTILLCIGAIAIALPLGLLSAIYLNEYAANVKNKHIQRLIAVIDQAVNNLAGVPSIVFGAFGLAFFNIFLKIPKSMIAGWLTLACMILPTIIRTSQEALKSVPKGYREGSLALGATKWQTIRHIVLPAATPGIATGVILSIGRAAGETAAILFVGSAVLPQVVFFGFHNNFAALSTQLLALYNSHPTEDNAMWLIALTLVAIVFTLNFAAIMLRNRAEKRRGRY